MLPIATNLTYTHVQLEGVSSKLLRLNARNSKTRKQQPIFSTLQNQKLQNSPLLSHQPFLLIQQVLTFSNHIHVLRYKQRRNEQVATHTCETNERQGKLTTDSSVAVGAGG